MRRRQRTAVRQLRQECPVNWTGKTSNVYTAERWETMTHTALTAVQQCSSSRLCLPASWPYRTTRINGMYHFLIALLLQGCTTTSIGRTPAEFDIIEKQFEKKNWHSQVRKRKAAAALSKGPCTVQYWTAATWETRLISKVKNFECVFWMLLMNHLKEWFLFW